MDATQRGPGLRLGVPRLSGRDPLQQGGARQCRESIGDRQGSCEIGDASVLDESERQVFGVVEVIQDLVVRGTDFVTS